MLTHDAMVDPQDLGGRSPLCHVCEELKDKQLKYDAHIIDQMDNQFKIVNELTNYQANPSLCDNLGVSPVQLALEYENITLFEALDDYEEAIALIFFALVLQLLPDIFISTALCHGYTPSLQPQ